LARLVDELVASGSRRLYMRGRARSAFESRYTADANYGMLLGIYERALKLAADSPQPRSKAV
jgi:hypothetical protein